MTTPRTIAAPARWQTRQRRSALPGPGLLLSLALALVSLVTLPIHAQDEFREAASEGAPQNAPGSRSLETRTLFFDQNTGRTRPISVRATLFPLESPVERLHRQLRGHDMEPLLTTRSEPATSPAAGLLRMETDHPGPLLLRLIPGAEAEPFEPLEIAIPPFSNRVALVPAILHEAKTVAVVVRTPDGQPALWSWLRDAQSQPTNNGWRPMPLAAFVDERARFDVPVAGVGRAIEIVNEWSFSLRWLEGRSDRRPFDDIDRPLAPPDLLRLELRHAGRLEANGTGALILIDGRPVATTTVATGEPVELWVTPGSRVEALASIAKEGNARASTTRGSLLFREAEGQDRVLVLRDDAPPPREIVDSTTGRTISDARTVEVYDAVKGQLLGHRIGAPGYLETFQPATQQTAAGAHLARASTLAGRIEAPGGVPVAHATVLLHDRESDEILAAAYSNQQGAFVLPRVPAGISARLSAEAFALTNDGSPLEPLTTEAMVATPPAGEVSSDTVLILQGRTRVTGRIIDDSGRAIAEARVSIRSLDPVGASTLRTVKDRNDNPLASTLTTTPSGEDGVFIVEHQPGQRLQVTVAKAGFATLAFDRRLAESSAPNSIHLDAIDLGVFVLPAEHQLQLLIQDSDEAPIPGAEVALDLLTSHSDEGRIGTLAQLGTGLGAPDLSAIVPGHELVPGVSDENGRLTIGALPPNSRISLLVARDGFVMKRLFGLEPSPIDGISSSTAAADSTGEPIRVVLEPEAVVSGQVFDHQGTPVQNAHVALEGSSAAPLPPNLWDKSNDHGAFRIGGLPAGRYRLWARADDQPEYEAIRFEIDAGQELEGLDFHAPESAWIDGEVLDRDGMPISGAVVVAELQLARTERNGSFRLEPVSLGEQTVEARLPNGDQLARTVRVPVDGVTVTLQRPSQDARDGVRLSGRVLDRDGFGIDGIRLTLTEDSSPRREQTRSDVDGAFVFFGLSAGQYSLSANQQRAGTGGERSEYTVVYQDIVVAPDASDVAEVTVTLGPAARFEGILIGDDEERSATWFALLRSDSGEERRAFLPPGQSDFELTSLRPGLWQIEVRRARAGRTPVTLGKAERLITPQEVAVTVEIDVRQEDQDEGAVLRGQVQRLDRTAGQVEGNDRLWLVLARPGERASRSATLVGSLGTFEFESLEPGIYDLMVASDRTVLSHLERLDLYQDRETTVAVEERLLTGVVVDASTGSPISGVRIMVVGPGGDSTAGPVTRTTTGAQGRYQVLALVQTSSFLQVSKEGYQSQTFALTETELSLSRAAPAPIE